MRLAHVVITGALVLGCGEGSRIEKASASLTPKRPLVFDYEAIPLPAETPRKPMPAHLLAAGAAHKMFVNFAGGQVRGDGSCSASESNCSWIVRCPSMVDYPRYLGTAEQRDATLAIVRNHLAPYNVEVVTERPTTGPYTMIMVGGTPATICYAEADSGVLGVAPLDCGNQNEADIVFAFSEVDASPEVMGQTIAHEGAHSWGLEHTDDTKDVEYPAAIGVGVLGFLDKVMGVVRLNQDFSVTIVASNCDGTMQQNSHARMVAALGANAPDSIAPTVTIGYPQDGTTGFRPDRPVTVRAGVSDNYPLDRIHDVTLVIDQGMPAAMRLVDAAAPYQWPVQLSPGAHTLLVEAKDGSDLVGQSAVVHITVAEGAGGAGAGGAGTGGAGTGGGGAAGGTGTAGADGAAGTSGGAGASGSGNAPGPTDLGAPCEGDTDCRGFCVIGAEGGICSRSCAASSECGSGLQCRDFYRDGGDKVCTPTGFAPPAAATASSGCASTPARTSTTSAALLIGILTMLAFRRRSRV